MPLSRLYNHHSVHSVQGYFNLTSALHYVQTLECQVWHRQTLRSVLPHSSSCYSNGVVRPPLMARSRKKDKLLVTMVTLSLGWLPDSVYITWQSWFGLNFRMTNWTITNLILCSVRLYCRPRWTSMGPNGCSVNQLYMTYGMGFKPGFVLCVYSIWICHELHLLHEVIKISFQNRLGH